MDKNYFIFKAKRLVELSNNNMLYKVKVTRNPQVTRDYKKRLKKVVSNVYKDDPIKKKVLLKKINSMDPDHVQELQLNGLDDRVNLKMAEKYAQRKMGINIASQLKSVNDGKRVKVVVDYNGKRCKYES